MNEEKRKSPEYEINNDACQFNGEEINEFAIFDCTSRARKRELTIKKSRRAYVGESIIVKLLMKNPLMADIFINSIKLTINNNPNIHINIVIIISLIISICAVSS